MGSGRPRSGAVPSRPPHKACQLVAEAWWWLDCWPACGGHVFSALGASV